MDPSVPAIGDRQYIIFQDSLSPDNAPRLYGECVHAARARVRIYPGIHPAANTLYYIRTIPFPCRARYQLARVNVARRRVCTPGAARKRRKAIRVAGCLSVGNRVLARGSARVFIGDDILDSSPVSPAYFLFVFAVLLPRLHGVVDVSSHLSSVLFVSHLFPPAIIP